MKFSKMMSERLNSLLESTYDAEKGYLNAMNRIDEPVELKMFFKRRAAQRGDFARDLRREILSYGEMPEESGTLRGTTHRFWTNIRSLLSENKQEAVLEECLRAEKKVIEEYNEILKEQKTLPPSTVELLTKHSDAIRNAINKVHLFEEMVS